MVLAGGWWFWLILVVLDVSWWFYVFLGSSWWFLLILFGSWWFFLFLVFFGGFCWLLWVKCGVLCFLVVLGGSL